MHEGSLKSYYEACTSDRDAYLRRARDSANLTIPFLVPPDSAGSHTDYPSPYQSVGARGVNNLASKLLLALLPPNSPFFRLVIDKFELQKAGEQDDPTLQTEIEKALAEIERAVQAEVETSAVRVGVFEALKQLIVAGNVLLYVPDKGGLRVFNMDRYICKRDPMGNTQSIIVRESIDPDVLPTYVREAVEQAGQSVEVSAGGHGSKKSVEVYTAIYRDKDKWQVRQEVADINIVEAQGTYPLDKNPWMPLRYTRIENENYGRGFIEEYIGDLTSLEGLTQAIVEASAAAAKVLFLVNPNGTTRPRTLSSSPNGAIVQGNSQDVTVLQLEKFADLRVAQETVDQIKERLGFAFLMNSSIQRSGERVTAEEIRFMAQELEDVLGGVYSILSQEFQMPLVNRLMDRMAKAGRLPKLPKKIIKTTIVTGLEALGRGHDLNKLDTFVGGVQQLIGPEEFAKYVNTGNYLKRRATALGIDVEGLVRTDEEIEQEQQEAQQQQMMQNVAPNVVNQAGAMAKDNPEGAAQVAQQMAQQQ